MLILKFSLNTCFFQLIANNTYNTDLLTNSGFLNEGAILIVGKQFSGCILEGPSIVFNTSVIHPHEVSFIPCPIPTDSCKYYYYNLYK